MLRLALFALPMALAAAPALARPELASATPAAGATVSAPGQIALRMSEPIAPRNSGASLVMTGMPGMADHAPMKMAIRASVARDGRTLVLTPARKLPAGQYRVEWFAVSASGERSAGTHMFGVR